MLIDKDIWVTVWYRLFDAQGEPLENGERELTYLQGGYGSVFPQIESALQGQSEGYTTSVHLEPEDSFGDYDAELVHLAPRDQFPDELEVGMSFEGFPGQDSDSDAEPLIHIVTDIADGVVVLDANHPLAGLALRFDVRVIAVREASEDEIAREREIAQEDPDDQFAGSSDVQPARSGTDEDNDFDSPADEETEHRSFESREARRLH